MTAVDDSIPFSWLEAPVAFVDLETTGGNPAYHRVIEVGIVAASAGGLEYEWSSLVNPGMPIPYGVQHITGITDEMVEHAPIFEDIAARLVERFEGRLFVAHNVRFDYSFLREEFRRSGIRFESRVACTVRLSRRVNPGLPRHNLDMLIAYLGLNITRRHRALPDAQALWQFWCDLRARPNREDIDQALAKITRERVPKVKLRRIPDASTRARLDASGPVATRDDAQAMRDPEARADLREVDVRSDASADLLREVDARSDAPADLLREVDAASDVPAGLLREVDAASDASAGLLREVDARSEGPAPSSVDATYHIDEWSSVAPDVDAA